jgi:hypothetical protein
MEKSLELVRQRTTGKISYKKEGIIMKSLLLFFTLFTLVSIASADEIKFTNGQWIRNVLVTDTLDNTITVITPTDTRHFKLTVIEEIIKASYNPLGSIIVSNAASSASQDSLPQSVIVRKIYVEKEYPNLNFLVISGLSILLSYEFFSAASDIGGEIDDMRKLNQMDLLKGLYDEQITKYESMQSRKSILGWGCAAVALASTIISLQSVEIAVTPNSLNVSYNLP